MCLSSHQLTEEKRVLEEEQKKASEEYIQRLLAEEEQLVQEESKRREDDERLARLLSDQLVSDWSIDLRVGGVYRYLSSISKVNPLTQSSSSSP